MSIGIPLVTILYILVNVAYFSVMTPAEIMSSNAVALVSIFAQTYKTEVMKQNGTKTQKIKKQ